MQFSSVYFFITTTGTRERNLGLSFVDFTGRISGCVPSTKLHMLAKNSTQLGPDLTHVSTRDLTSTQLDALTSKLPITDVENCP